MSEWIFILKVYNEEDTSKLSINFSLRRLKLMTGLNNLDHMI